MPHEYVHPELGKQQGIEVHWDGAGAMVTLGVTTRDENDAKIYAETIIAEGKNLVSFGWFATMTDRRQINDLIKKLRRARDHAFGADE